MLIPSWSEQDLKTAVETSTNLGQVINKLGLKLSSSRYHHFNSVITNLNISTTHFTKSKRTNNPSPKRDYNEILTFNSKKEILTSFAGLKNFIKKHKLLAYKCSNCNLLPEWQNKTLVLQLDHIDGNKNNNLLTNLRFLCPNCHSQTPTYGGKHNKNTYVPDTCPLCKKEIARYAKLCRKCSGVKRWKVSWPTPDKMQELVWQKSTTLIARDLGVCDNAVSAFCKKHKINKPTRGYWNKVYAGKL